MEEPEAGVWPIRTATVLPDNEGTVWLNLNNPTFQDSLFQLQKLRFAHRIKPVHCKDILSQINLKR